MNANTNTTTITNRCVSVRKWPGHCGWAEKERKQICSVYRKSPKGGINAQRVKTHDTNTMQIQIQIRREGFRKLKLTMQNVFKATCEDKIFIKNKRGVIYNRNGCIWANNFNFKLFNSTTCLIANAWDDLMMILSEM